MKFITGEDLELWQCDKSKERYVLEKLEFDEAASNSYFTKFVQGRFLDELGVRRLYEKDYRNASDRISLSLKTRVIGHPRQMYQNEVFEDMQNNGRNLKTFFISGSSGLGKSKICKDLARSTH